MKDKSLDDVKFKCPVCQKAYLGQNISNPFEDLRYCDWCALGFMLKDQPPGEMKVRTVILRGDGNHEDLGVRTVQTGGQTKQERIVESN